jgi:hypothetical protein
MTAPGTAGLEHLQDLDLRRDRCVQIRTATPIPTLRGSSARPVDTLQRPKQPRPPPSAWANSPLTRIGPGYRHSLPIALTRLQ